MLMLLGEKSQDKNLQKARNLCVSLYAQMDTARRARDINMSHPDIAPFQTQEVFL
jgi:hypothetical protein